jgi:hypothetical protein
VYVTSPKKKTQYAEDAARKKKGAEEQDKDR